MSVQLAMMERTALSGSCSALHGLRHRGHMAQPHAQPSRKCCQHGMQQHSATCVAQASVGSPDVDNSVAEAVHSAPDRSNAQLAADAAVATQPDATAGERARLLAIAKQRIAALRATKAAEQAAEQQAAQESDSVKSRAAESTAAEAGQPQQSSPAVTPTQASARPTAAAEQQPSTTEAPATASSPGAVAARAARQRTNPVSASAAWAPANGALPAFPPKNPRTRRRVERSMETVDAQRYEQVVASRNRLAASLSKVNRYVTHLEGELAGRSADVSAAADSLAEVNGQLQLLLRQAGLAAGGAGGSDGAQVFALTQQLARFQQQVQRHQRKLEQSAVQAVPLAWVGVAQEVRLMGSFDNWSRGVAMSSAGDAGDSVFHRFEGTLHARKGEYSVKFLVDGQWRLAPQWPTRDDATGTANNVLKIE